VSLFFQYPLKNPTAAGSAGNNWSFEQGMTGWVADSTNWYVAFNPPGPFSATPYHGNAVAGFDAYATRIATGTLYNTDTFAVSVGQSKTATCQVNPNDRQGFGQGRMGVQWLDAADAIVSTSWGNWITIPTGGWTTSTVTAACPAGASKVRICIGANNTDTQNYGGRVVFDWCTLV